jgi:hypothetical protein
MEHQKSTSKHSRRRECCGNAEEAEDFTNNNMGFRVCSLGVLQAFKVFTKPRVATSTATKLFVTQRLDRI